MASIVSAVFDDRRDAENAANELRDLGISENAISVLARHDSVGETDMPRGRDAAVGAVDAGKGTAAGLGIGAGTGAILGLAAAFIPGVGPFLAGGALVQALGLVGASTVAGAVVGGVSGGIAGALSHWGLNEAEARYYAGEVEHGATYLGVDLDRTTASWETVLDVFRRHHGRVHGSAMAASSRYATGAFDADREVTEYDTDTVEDVPASTHRAW